MNRSYESSALLRILAPHFVAGIELEDYKVVRCAPILNYMIGWDLERINEYCKSKDWTVEVIDWEF